MNSKHLRHGLSGLIGLLLFAAAAWILRRELSNTSYEELLEAARAVPTGRMLLALVLTVASYFLLTLYDVLAMRHIGRELPYSKVGFISFTAYVTSHNLGLAGVGGSAVRFRLYSGIGLPATEIATVVAFCGITYWIGFMFVGGIVFSLTPLELPPELPLPLASSRQIGWVLLGAFGVVLAGTLSARKSYSIRGWTLRPPTRDLMARQVSLTSVDWALNSCIVYVLMPPSEMGLVPFFGVYIAAALASLISHVPAGLGVFETVVIVLMPAAVPREQILGGLILYRGIYYILPLVIGVLGFGLSEATRRRVGLRRLGRYVRPLVRASLPRVMAVATFLAGVVLLVSASTPDAGERLEWLEFLEWLEWLLAPLPLALVELSHMACALVGTGLLVLSLGLRRRLDAAWLWSCALLAVGIVASLTRGGDWGEALALAVVLAGLLPSRPAFYRRAALAQQRLELGWMCAATAVVAGSLLLVWFSHRPLGDHGDLESGGDLWWRFSFSAEASRSMRAGALAAGLLAALAALRLWRPARYVETPPTAEDLERARAITAAAAGTTGHLAQLGDKELLFSPGRDAFVMYRVVGRLWIALGDPVGPRELHRKLTHEFREKSQLHGGHTAFYKVGDDDLTDYVDAGLGLLKVGEEALVDLASFSGAGALHGASFEVLAPEGVDGVLGELARISSAWLASRDSGEQGFSLGFFDERYLRTTPVALVRVGGEAVAFANLWLGGRGEELAVDLMRHVPDAPAGAVAHLRGKIMEWGAARGFSTFSLGTAPLSGLESPAHAPIWDGLGRTLLRHAAHFDGAGALRAHAAELDPAWRPRFLALEDGLAIPDTLAQLATLIDAGPSGVLPE